MKGFLAPAWKRCTGKSGCRALLAILLLVFLFTVYMAAAGVAWQVRNPKGNQATVSAGFRDVVLFKKLPEFQLN